MLCVLRNMCMQSSLTPEAQAELLTVDLELLREAAGQIADSVRDAEGERRCRVPV